jgi:hypothetical protein
MLPARILPSSCPFWDKRVTLGLVRDGHVEFDNAVSSKERTLRAFVAGELAGAVVLVAWTGRYSTDLFALTTADVTRLLQDREK